MKRRHILAGTALALTLLLGSTVRAGQNDIDVRLYEPAPDDFGGLSFLGSRVPPSLESVFGLSLDFARNPLIMVDGRDEVKEVVGAALSADLFVSFGIIDMFQVSLTLPIALYTSGDGLLPGDDISASGLGDIRLMAKWEILGRDEYPVGFAFANALNFPSALPRNNFLGGSNDGVLYEPRLIVDAKVGPALLAANLGYRTRPTSKLLSLRVGDEWFYAVGAVFEVIPEVDLLGELFGATTAHAPFGSHEVQHTLEGILGGRYRPPGTDLMLRGGMGFGLLPGYGCPEFRIILGLTWAPKLGEPKPEPEPEPEPTPTDRDGDGLLDPDDKCPDEAEDKDGFQDEDGCPDPDNDEDGVLDADDKCGDEKEDQDGFEDDDGCPDPDNDGDKILDVNDKCPNKPESMNGTDDDDGCPEGDQDKDGILDAIDKCPADKEDVDGHEDEDGCPDNDNDGDGIPDATDGCPNEAEDIDGFEDEDGCLDPDNDGDSVKDADDKCPDEPEDIDGFEDTDGCPDPDNDKDGVPDAKDKCPDEPETINGIKDKDGCPDKGAVKVLVTKERIEIKDKIYFAAGKARIKRKSYSLLDQVAMVLVAHPEIKGIRIEGHTDSRGSRKRNIKLSLRRAKAVLKRLVKMGVARDRLEAVGIGPDRPIDSNKTKLGRANNRRVEFHIAGPKKETLELPALVPPKKTD